MTILHKIDAQGGFTVADTNTGITAYAYPSSVHALAARKKPDEIAALMAIKENTVAWTRHVLPDARERDAQRIAALLCEGGLPELPADFLGEVEPSVKAGLVKTLMDTAEKLYLGFKVSTEQFNGWHFRLQRLLGLFPADAELV